MRLYIPKEEDYFKSYSKELEEYIERLEHENERIYTRLDDKDKEIERLNKENEELKHKLKLINSYVYGCDIDSLGSDKE